MARLMLRAAALTYLALILLLPLGMMVLRAFGSGPVQVWRALTSPDALHALWLTVLIALIVVPLNAAFGVLCALVLVRHEFGGKRALNALVGLPLSLSPVVVGLALLLAYGQDSWFGGWLAESGIRLIFSLPGMVLATLFVSLPFVVREVVPVLREVGREQEEAASTLGASPWRTLLSITLPSIGPGVAYGVVLTTARALGEFGAVSVVSGNVEGRTQTLTMYVADRFEQFDVTGAYAASLLLALLGVATLLMMNRISRRQGR